VSSGWLIGGLIVGAFHGLIFGLMGGLGVRSLNDITLVEILSWQWNPSRERMIRGEVFADRCKRLLPHILNVPRTRSSG